MKQVTNKSNVEIKTRLASGDIEIAPGASIVVEDNEAESLRTLYSDRIQKLDQTVQFFSFLEISDHVEPLKAPKVVRSKKDKLDG